MTRKELEDLGLSKEQVDAVIKINGADIENAKSASAAEIKNLQTEVSYGTAWSRWRKTKMHSLPEW